MAKGDILIAKETGVVQTDDGSLILFTKGEILRRDGQPVREGDPVLKQLDPELFETFDARYPVIEETRQRPGESRKKN